MIAPFDNLDKQNLSGFLYTYPVFTFQVFRSPLYCNDNMTRYVAKCIDIEGSLKALGLPPRRGGFHKAIYALRFKFTLWAHLFSLI
jgi:hypothetical protein